MKVIFTSSNLPFALAIRFFTGCKWHHCGAIYKDNYVIESRAFLGFKNACRQIKNYVSSGGSYKTQFTGVTTVSLEDFKSRGDWCIIEYNLKDELKAEKFLYDQIGKPYDFGGAIAYPFRGDWQDRLKWYCSEKIGAASDIGETPIVREGVRSITPRDLFINPNGELIAKSL